MVAAALFAQDSPDGFPPSFPDHPTIMLDEGGTCLGCKPAVLQTSV